MRILDDKSDLKLNSISLFLTKNEAIQLTGYLEELINNKKIDHSHFISEDYQKEITLCIYDPENAANFQPRIQKLIQQDI